MVTKEKLYSLIIITIYLMSCFTIFNDTKSKTIYTKIKEKNITPIEKDIIGSISIDKINLQKPLYKIESKKNKMRIDYDEQARERLSKMESSYRFEAEKKISKIEADKDKKTQAFDKVLSQNREKLLDEVFEAVTGTKRRN